MRHLHAWRLTKKSGDSKSRIELGMGEELERVDNDLVGGGLRIEKLGDTEQTRDLTSGDVLREERREG